MMEPFDRIDAKTQLYWLAKEAEAKIEALAAAQEKATYYRLRAMPTNAQFNSTEAALLSREIEQIGKRQNAIIAQLEAAGEVIHL